MTKRRNNTDNDAEMPENAPPKEISDATPGEDKIPEIVNELQRVQAELTASREQYLDFYDLAPVGYLTVGETGLIQEANFTAVTMLSVTRENLVNQPIKHFVAHEDRDSLTRCIEEIIATRQPQILDIKMVRSENIPFWVRLGVIAAQDSNDAIICRMVLTDITEQKQAETALAQYETRYRALYESTNDAVMLLDERGFFDCNEATLCMFGCRNKTEFCSKHPADLSPVRQPCGTNSILLANQHIATAMSYGANRFEWIHKRFDNNQEFSTEVFLSRLKIDQRIVIMAVVKDISARKQAEADLARFEMRYRVLYESTSDAVMLLDENGFFDGNKATLNMFGCRDIAEFCGKHPADLSPATQPCGTDSITLGNRYIAEAMEQGAKRFEWTYKRLDTGAEHPAEVSISRMHIDGRNVLLAFVRDITERKQTEKALREAYDLLEQRVAERTAQLQAELEEHRRTQQALQESEQQLRNLADNLPNAVVYQVTGNLDGTRAFTYVGRGVERLNEISTQEMLADAEKLYGQMLPEYRANVDASEKEALTKKAPLHVEVQSRLPSGRIRWFEYAATPRQRDDGSLVLDGVEVDITERKQAETSLREANRQLEEATAHARSLAAMAEEANHAKSRFVANMSHEIRTPLHAITGYAQILGRDSSLTDRQREEVNTILRNGEHLLVLINEILDLSRIEAGRLALNITAFCLHDLLDDFERMFRFSAQAKGLYFEMDIQDRLPRWIETDAAKFRQVFINLLGNAVKFTHTGGIVLRVRFGDIEAETSEASPGTIRLMVEVEDSGPGIPAEDMENIFNAFQQSETGTYNEGAGLGLTISRRLARIMGGDLVVESRVGHGSCFQFSVPVMPTTGPSNEDLDEQETWNAAEQAPVATRVLIVDDNPDMRGLLRDLLMPIGYEIKEAANGHEAIGLFEQWHPDAVLMDMRMPVMDGYEAIRRIKATEAGQNTVIIAETASAFVEDRETILEAGADGYICKPFKMKEILGTLQKLLSQRMQVEEKNDDDKF